MDNSETRPSVIRLTRREFGWLAASALSGITAAGAVVMCAVRRALPLPDVDVVVAWAVMWLMAYPLAKLAARTKGGEQPLDVWLKKLAGGVAVGLIVGQLFRFVFGAT